MFALKVTLFYYPSLSLEFFIMSSNDFLAAVTEIADTNPNAYQFIIDLTNSENGNDVLDAIDTYDQTVLDAYTDVVAV